MIKIIKEGKLLKLPKELYRITCEDCLTVFECSEDDCGRSVVGHGRISEAIACPVCGRKIMAEMNSLWRCINLAEIREVQKKIWEQEDERKKVLENA